METLTHSCYFQLGFRMSLEPLCTVVATWAEKYPDIRRVWLYGSRVKGTARPDSDLDIAVEIHPRVFRGQSTFMWWILESVAMKATLSALMTSPVPHIQHYEQSEIEVLSGVAEHHVLVYQSGAAPPI